MPKKPRLIITGLPHHVTQRGNNKQKVFFDDNDYLKYLTRFEEYRIVNQLSVISFCLMPNHVHFIVIPKKNNSLSLTLHNTHKRYAQYFNSKYLHCGHVWQGRFFSCPFDMTALLRVLKYVEINPLRAGLVNNIMDWEWSSAPYHISGKKSAIILDNIPGMLPPSPELWKEYLQEDVGTKFTEAIRKCTQRGKLFEKDLVQGPGPSPSLSFDGAGGQAFDDVFLKHEK